jgi:hypothetical protein
MAWTAPATWSVSEVVTAAKMNLHVRDNLKYLKGQSGAVVLEDRLEVPATSGTTGHGLRFTTGALWPGTLQGLDVSSSSFLFFATNRFYTGSAWDQLNSRAGGAFQMVNDAAVWYTFAAASSTAVERMRLDNTGALGIGTATPAGRLHVAGAGAVSGAGFAISSVAAVTSIQTIFAAGTVARGVMCFILDRNNTGAGLNSPAAISAIAALSGSFTYTNTDTITIAVTAGGAITAQRTSGTNGSHDIVMLALFL